MNNQNLRYLGVIAIISVIVMVTTNDAFAVNSTAINEAQAILEPELEIKNSFHVFWIIFFLIMLAVFMGVMFKMRENGETIFFSIGAVIVSVLITLMLTSPLDFDLQESEITVTITEQNGIIIESQITNKINQTIVFPADSSWRFVLSSFFTVISIFNGLYSIFILTNFPLTKRGIPQ